MLFLFLNNVDIRSAERGNIIWRNYTNAKALPNNKKVKPINKREFAKATLDKNAKIFMVHITMLSAFLIHTS